MVAGGAGGAGPGGSTTLGVAVRTFDVGEVCLMDTTEWDRKIADLDGSVAQVLGPMERQAQLVMDAVAVWLASWWQETARDAVAERARQVARHSVPEETVASARASVRGLVASAGDAVRRHLDVDVVWAHRQNLEKVERQDRGTYGYGNSGSMHPGLPGLEDGVRRAMGEVAPILVDHGFVEVGGYWRQDRGQWVHRSMHLDPPPEVVGALDGYRDLYGQLRDALGDLAKAKKDRAAAVAVDKWDTA